MNSSNNTVTIIGISPRNPYYSDQNNIAYTCDEVLQRGGRAYVMVPDVPDFHNYLAFGYDPIKAKKKAFSVGHTLKQSVREICARRDYTPAQIHIMDWAKEIDPHPLYRAKLDEMEILYRTDTDFCRDVRSATAAVLQSRMEHNSTTKKHIRKTCVDSAVDEAIRYSLAELAFIASAHNLLGGTHTEYVYHQPWPVYENFIQGNYGYERPENLSFRIINRIVKPASTAPL